MEITLLVALRVCVCGGDGRGGACRRYLCSCVRVRLARVPANYARARNAHELEFAYLIHKRSTHPTRTHKKGYSRNTHTSKHYVLYTHSN